MAEDRFLLDSPAIEKAVAFHNSADYPPRRPGKNSLDDVPAMGGGENSYNGYFTIKDVSLVKEDGTVEFRVAICDGKTWDAVSLTSGFSYAVCRGDTIRFDSKIFPVTESVSVYIKCGPTDYYRNEIVLVPHSLNKPPEMLGYAYYLIGDVLVAAATETTSASMRIIQRHGEFTPTVTQTDSSYYGYNGEPHIPYHQWYGYFSVRFVEDAENGAIVPNKLMVCNGLKPGLEYDSISRATWSEVYIIDFPAQIFDVSENGDIVIIYGATKNYKHYMVFVPDKDRAKYIAPGYEMFTIAKVRFTDGVMDVFPEFYANDDEVNNHTRLLPYDQYYGGFSVRFKENSDGTFDGSNATLVHGLYWNSEIAGASVAYVNNMGFEVPALSLSGLSFGRLYLVYDAESQEFTVDTKLINADDHIGAVYEDGQLKAAWVLGDYRDGIWTPASPNPPQLWVMTEMCAREMDID